MSIFSVNDCSSWVCAARTLSTRREISRRSNSLDDRNDSMATVDRSSLISSKVSSLWWYLDVLETILLERQPPWSCDQVLAWHCISIYLLSLVLCLLESNPLYFLLPLIYLFNRFVDFLHLLNDSTVIIIRGAQYLRVALIGLRTSEFRSVNVSAST